MTVRIRNAQRLRLPLSLQDIRHKAAVCFRRAKLSPAGELSIILLSSRAMRSLNRRSLGHDYVTDVVTFDLTEVPGTRRKAQVPGRTAIATMAEIYICPAEIRRNALDYGEPFARELLRCVVHGILHLSGLDDATMAQRRRMRLAEDHLLK